MEIPSTPSPDDTSPEYSDDTSRSDRRCGWCHGPIRRAARADALYCSQRCRQAAHRFNAGATRRVASIEPKRFAYADPPYPGMAHLYRDHRDYAGEVDHRELVERLCDVGPDGWALSTSARALRDVWELCPPGTWLAPWFRGERPTTSWVPLNAWEPVLVWGGRAHLSPVDARRLDALVYVSRPRLTDPDRVIGAKPAAFCWWLFDLLGALPGDELVDLFPGAGTIGRAWDRLELLSRPASSDGSPGPERREAG